MHPGPLERLYVAPTEGANKCRWRGMRQRLQGVRNEAGERGKIYINGKTFSGADLQFLIDHFQPPQD